MDEIFTLLNCMSWRWRSLWGIKGLPTLVPQTNGAIETSYVLKLCPLPHMLRLHNETLACHNLKFSSLKIWMGRVDWFALSSWMNEIKLLVSSSLLQFACLSILLILCNSLKTWFCTHFWAHFVSQTYWSFDPLIVRIHNETLLTCRKCRARRGDEDTNSWFVSGDIILYDWRSFICC